jgi:hypothetical protein
MDAGPRGSRDDFFCWRFRVWYNLRDCNFRHHFQTHALCADCEQGAANLEASPGVPQKPRWMDLPQPSRWPADEDED